ncbi:OpgC domain-containing protein [Bradyrhizobium sp.]|uniref:OpgC domain-containing protein n=1 Tax=Bradyrhizobium sp. TaxID=376 RepID=UPI00261606FE|nr:OpgC domain-containing protein [Bradyrhizobium sp.]
MNANAVLVRNARDTRLYLFLGLANWFIFLDHIPNNVVSWITLRSLGFSGASDVFVFIMGYAAALTYAPIMLERGTIVGATRVLKRAWQLYAAFIVLFAIYAVSIGDVATRYAAPDIIYEFNMAGLLDDPVRTVAHGLLLQSKALNLDLLQLAVVLMACFPIVLWLMLRLPNVTLAASVGLYLAARQYQWTLSAFPDGSWYLDPFCWQLLFVLGAWCALGGASRILARLRSPAWAYAGLAYLVFAFAVTMAARFPALGDMLPTWLHHVLMANDRANLGPYRLLHFGIMALFATRLIPKNWPGLNSPALTPLIVCGEQALPVFCAGVFLSFTGHFILVTGSGSVVQQIMVSLSGIVIMTLVASYVSWSKRQDGQSLAPLNGRASLGIR